MTRTRRPSSSLSWSALLLSAVIGPAPVAAQSAPGIVDLVNLPTVSSPQLSPDGTELLYVRSDADWEDNRTVGHIWRIGVDGSGEIRLTSGEDGEADPRWSPDGTRIVFTATRGDDGAAQIDEGLVEMYRGVRHNGIPTHLYVAPRQGHGWSELRHRLYKANIELEWFETWVTERKWTWEEAPVEDKPARPVSQP